jgi:hypothetical protein
MEEEVISLLKQALTRVEQAVVTCSQYINIIYAWAITEGFEKIREKKMMNKLSFVIGLLMLTTLLGVVTNVAHAGVTPPQGGWKWLAYTFNGKDAFYGDTIYAYQANSTAILSVTVYNDYVLDKQLNISALKVGLNWGANYTSSETSLDTPYTIPWHESRVIPIIFKVPNLTNVSNQAQYSYTIYLEYVNSTTGPRQVIDTDMQFGGNDFVVYSVDQAAAQKSMQMVVVMQSIIKSPTYFNSTAAKLKWIDAENETSVAEMLYAQGNFAGAKDHYNTALSLINQAMASEQAKGGGFDDAQVQVLQAQAKSLEATANYLNALSNMWILIGVAAVLFAIGYIIRGFAALRKPVPTT